VPPDLSVIIPVRRDPRIGACLDSLFRRQAVSPEEFEVLVVDNGPSEEVRRIVSRYPARYLVEPRRGSYAARNRGIGEARGQVLVFTDADCVPPLGWLKEIRSLFEDEACGAAVGPSYTLNGSKVALWVQSVDDERWWALSRESAVVYCDTRNFAARRQVLAAERFDPDFLNAGDVELGYRLARRGETICFAAQMQTGHENPSSLWAVLVRGVRRGRGIGALYRKHGPAARLSAERRLELLGWDIKPRLLALIQRQPLRWLGIAALMPMLAGLYALLLLLDASPLHGRCGRRAFRLLDRASILLGRLLSRRPVES
jgi:glycosyltransferase involved in cell wall biosynthesis